MNPLKKQGKIPLYETSFKVAIAREYLTGNLGYGNLAKKYNIPAPSVAYFVKWYRKRSSDSAIDTNALPLTPQEDRTFEQQLKEANLKIAGLEMLIEIASKELSVDIVKKLGAKQSKQ